MLLDDMFGTRIILHHEAERGDNPILYPSTDQAAKYVCAAILKDSDYNEVDRAECQFATTSTVLDNGSQCRVLPFIHQRIAQMVSSTPLKASGMNCGKV
ncbi:hypothetical protein TorRG33x02_118530 [Trema orientale]|uniref:Generative cell specific-1/HAP2 domain-containing protein n=1 Tax=Trema orientale TaxID=63057 RepID=A0A2P5F3I8_TREOI|nr:hypothetical protein TorRG33x02_118530 [Trema orientale]